MSTKPSKTSFEKSLNKLNGLISTLEERTGMTQELLKAEGITGTTTAKTNVQAPKPAQTEQKPVEQKPVEEKKVEEKKPSEKKEKKEKEPKEPKAEKKPAKAAEKTIDEITAEDFARLDIRVGKIVECWKHPESDYLYCEKIDIGEEVREIGSGLQQCVPIAEMTSGLVLILSNLKARKLGGFPSHGMVLCAGDPNGSAFELLRPHPNSKIGERVFIEGLENITKEKADTIDPKKNKALETVLPKCNTVGGFATFMNLKFKTSAGEVTAKSQTDARIS